MEKQWLKLVDYGDYPHADGVQRVTYTAALEMQKRFRSLRARLARKFGGIPVYIGHPDDRHFSQLPGHSDTRSYAWVQDLEAREDGIWILPKWSTAGEEILQNAFFKFLSPRWETKRENGFLTPIRLISVGLTNNPNIPGEAIANQETQVCPEEMEDIELQAFLEKTLNIRFQDPDWKEQIVQLGAHAEAIEALKEANKDLQSESDRFYKLACEQEQKIKELTAALVDAKIASGERFAKFALNRGLIQSTEVDEWKERYIADPKAASNELLGQSQTLNTHSKTEHLENRHEPTDSQTHILKRVRERMQMTGEDYTAAWHFVRQSMPVLL
ncbi:MAG: phage protease [Opitutales bacterium]|nr:phage protease [Opitutales bacterium]